MNSDPVGIGPVVVGLDSFENGSLAVDWGCRQASLEHRGLILAHAAGACVVARPPELVDVVGGQVSRHRRRIDRDLHDARDHARRTAPGLDVRAMVLHDDAVEALIEASRSAAMLVLGVPGWRVGAPSVFRSVAVSVAKHAWCPVVVVRRAPHPGLESVLVGTDCGGKSQPALDFAFRTAAIRSWPLTVLHTFWDPSRNTGDVRDDQTGCDDERSALADIVRPHQECHPGVEVNLLLSRGFADQRLIQASGDHGLVVLGHRRRPFLEAMVWGDVTAPVLKHATGNVAIVPAQPDG